jgi:hypothetical protein
LLGLLLALLALLCTPTAARAQGAPGKKGPVSFINDVAPILKENCFACHDAKKRKGKLDMTTYENLRKGGLHDDPVVLDPDTQKVLLLQLLNSTGNNRMPPKEAGEALSKEKIAVLEQWIKEGAKLDKEVAANADLMRELRIRWKPPAPLVAYEFPVKVNALAFTPDNKHIVAGGYHELTVWNVADGKLVKRVWTRAERALNLVFLPDGQLVVAGGRPGQEGDVRVYDLSQPGRDVGGVAMLDGVNDKKVLVKELVETDDEVLALALSADGKKLAAAGCDRLVRVWDISGGVGAAKMDTPIENHADWVFGLAFSPDGKFLLTASRDKTAKVWDLAARESVLTFPDHQNGVYAVAMTPDGKIGISAAEDGNVRFWQATDANKQIGKQTKAGAGHTKVFRIAYHPDPKSPLMATCGAEGKVIVWNPVTATAMKTLTGHTDYVFSVAISPDGSLVAGGSYNGEVKVWKTGDGAPVLSFNASPGYVAKVEKK